MYKKQLALQKIICLLCVIVAAVSFVYSLGIMTDLYDSLYSTMMDPDDPTDTDVPGSIIYYDMQDFNKEYVNRNVVFILVSCLLLLTNTHVRRKYYIGNYVAIGAYSAMAIGVNLWAAQQVAFYKERYLTTVDFEALKEHAEMWETPYLDTTFWFDLHGVVLALTLVAVVALIANMIWKIVLMQGEKKLLKAGEEATV